MVQENETPEVTKEGVEQAQTEVPAKEDAVIKTEGEAPAVKTES
jgi:small subunit ribosomal protein S5